MPRREETAIMKRYLVPTTLLGLLALLLLAGCAGKNAAEQELPPRVDTAAPSTMTTDVSRQPTPLGVGSQGVQSGPVADHQAVAGLSRINFAYNQFTLDDASRQILEKNAAYLKAKATEKVVIEGHCDDRGSDEYNLALGERRAMAAKSYLVSLGIPAERLTTISYGEEQPLVTAANEEGWAQNRRAEFKVAR
jgi:peptidoglycan-associated lipoprotein